MTNKNYSEESKREYLGFIRDVVSRMYYNSVTFRYWTVALVALFAILYYIKGYVWLLLIPIIPTLTFWFFDAMFLHEKRKYLELLKDARADKIDVNTFPLSEHVKSETHNVNLGFVKVFLAKRMTAFYGGIVMSLLFFSAFLIIRI